MLIGSVCPFVTWRNDNFAKYVDRSGLFVRPLMCLFECLCVCLWPTGHSSTLIVLKLKHNIGLGNRKAPHFFQGYT